MLVLATGAASWMPPVPGIDSPGVFGLRNMADAPGYPRASQAGCAVTAIIRRRALGLDLSVALRGPRAGCIVIELLPRLLPRQLDDAGAEILCHAMSERAVWGCSPGHPCSHIRAERRWVAPSPWKMAPEACAPNMIVGRWGFGRSGAGGVRRGSLAAAVSGGRSLAPPALLMSMLWATWRVRRPCGHQSLRQLWQQARVLGRISSWRSEPPTPTSCPAPRSR